MAGFYSVMGKKMVETVYCDFTKSLGDPGKNQCHFETIISIKTLIFQLLTHNSRISIQDMDWIGWRPVSLRLFLRSEKQRFLR
jgi:hypothetical protein